MVSWPLTFPATVIEGVRLRPLVSVGAARSPFTFQEQLQAWGGEGWEMAIDVRLPAGEGQGFSGWLAGLRGRSGTFLLGVPTARRLSSTGSAPLVRGGGQSGPVLATRNWPANAPNVMRQGDYLQLGSAGNSRLHQVLADAGSDAEGHADLHIFPALRLAPADGDPIEIAGPVGVWRLAQEPEAFSISPSVTYRFTLNAREAL